MSSEQPSSPYAHLLAARETLQQLLQSCGLLASSLQAQRDDIRIDALYEIPLRGTPQVDPLARIQVQALHDAAGNRLLTEALASPWLRPEQNPKETLRAPGAVALPPALLVQIAACNSLRQQLFEHLQPLDQQTRIDLWRSHPGIASLQVLRQTPILAAPQKIRFYWDTGASIERRRVADLIDEYEKKLRERFGYSAALSQQPELASERKLAFALDLLARLDPQEQVAIWRPVSPHIRARVHDGEEPAYICSAPVPFVYSDELPEPQIKPLASYDPDNAGSRPRSSRAQLEVEPYFDALNIYRYAEAHRQFGPVEPRRLPRNARKQRGVQALR